MTKIILKSTNLANFISHNQQFEKDNNSIGYYKKVFASDSAAVRASLKLCAI